MSTISDQLAEERSFVRTAFEDDGLGRAGIVRGWPDINREDLHGAVRYLVGRGHVDDPMKGTAFHRKGTWLRGRVWYEWQNPQEMDKLQVFERLYKGGEIDPMVEVENGTRYLVETTFYHATTSIPALPAAKGTVGITYERGPLVRDPETGAYTTYVMKRTRIYEHVTSYTSEQGSLEYRTREDHLGVKSGDVNDAGADIGLPSMGAPTLGRRTTVVRRQGVDGTQDINVDTRFAVASDASDTHGSVLVTEVVAVHRNEASPPSPNPGAAGTIEDVSHSINEFGRIDYVQRTRTAKAKDASDTHGSALVTNVVAVHRNAAAAPSPGAGAAGTIEDVSHSINEFGLIDYVQSTRTAQAKNESDTHGSPLTQEVVVVHRNAASAPSPGAASAGTIVDVRHSINEFGLIDYVQSTRTAQDVDTGWQTYAGRHGTNAVRVYRNQTTIPTAVYAAGANSLQVGINEFGRYDVIASHRAVGTSPYSGSSEIEFSYTNRQGETIYVYKYFSTHAVNVEHWLAQKPSGRTQIIGWDSGHKTDGTYMGNGRYVGVKVCK